MKKTYFFLGCLIILIGTFSCNGKRENEAVETAPKDPANKVTQNGEDNTKNPTDTFMLPALDFPVAVINSDSLMEHYLYVKELKEKLDKKIKDYEMNFDTKVKNFQKEVQEFQEKAKYMTSTELQRKQEELMQKEQSLAALKEELGNKLMNEEAELSRALQEKVEAYLKKHKDQYRYKLILTRSALSNVLYYDSSIDITKYVIEGLNAEYRAANLVKK